MRTYWLTLYNKLVFLFTQLQRVTFLPPTDSLSVNQSTAINQYIYQAVVSLPTFMVSKRHICVCHFYEHTSGLFPLRGPTQVPQNCLPLINRENTSWKCTWNLIQWLQVIDTINLLSIGRIRLDKTHQVIKITRKRFLCFKQMSQLRLLIGQDWVMSPQLPHLPPSPPSPHHPPSLLTI